MSSLFSTVFLNKNFVEQQHVYYRVLCSILTQAENPSRFKEYLEVELQETIKDDNLFDFVKNNYRYQKTESAVLKAYSQIEGNRNIGRVHLNWEELAVLKNQGWEFGNHTLSHPTLASLTFLQQKREIEENAEAIQINMDESYINWLSYPNGAAKHVNEHTHEWLLQNQDCFGIFANGGANIFYTRTEWLRIPIGDHSVREVQTKVSQASYEINAVLGKF